MSLKQVQDEVLGERGVKLSDNPYWSFSDVLPLISADLTLFPHNGFYDTFSGIDPMESINGIGQCDFDKVESPLLVPHIRINDQQRIATLVEKGFRFLPTLGDAEFVSEPQGAFEHLRSVVGGKRYRDLRRLHRLSKGMSLIKIEAAQLLNEKPLLAEVVRICNEQELRYKNRTIMYGYNFIRALAKVGIKSSIEIYLRIQNKSVVQVIYVRHLRDCIVLMASATSSIAREMGFNLYAAMMIDAIDMKESAGKSILNIGRGDRATKLSYGADVYHKHVHAIKVSKPEHQRELTAFGGCVVMDGRDL